MKRRISILVMMALLAFTLPVQAAFFAGLGHLGGDDVGSRAVGISADGRVVVGHSHGPEEYREPEAFRWQYRGSGRFLTSPMEALGAVDGMLAGVSVNVYAVSANGGVIVGEKFFSYYPAPFRWTEADGVVNLGLSGGDSGYARDVTPDGETVVGGCYIYLMQRELPARAFRWTEAEGMVDLGTVADAGTYDSSEAYGISADGRVVVGATWGSEEADWVGITSDRPQQAFRWTQGKGMIGLGTLRPYTVSRARDVSGDGRVAVGSSWTWGEDGAEACLWDVKTGVEGLGDLPGGEHESWALATNLDGRVVVGVGNSDGGNEAVFWRDGKIYELYSHLIRKVTVERFGRKFNPLKGWTLLSALDVSADGETIVGNGINPEGETEAWIANIGRATAPPLRPPGHLRIVPE